MAVKLTQVLKIVGSLAIVIFVSAYYSDLKAALEIKPSKKEE